MASTILAIFVADNLAREGDLANAPHRLQKRLEEGKCQRQCGQ